MKILHVISGLGTGGAETMLYRLLSTVTNDADEHRVVCLGQSGAIGEQIKALGIAIDELAGRGRFSAPRVTLAATRIAREFCPDIIQGWMYDGNLAAWWMAKRCKGRLAWNIRHSIANIAREPLDLQLSIRLGAWFSGRPDVIIYNSHTAADQHHALGYSSAHTRILPNGFDTSVFKPDAEARARIRAELGIPADAWLIGMIARYHPMKDHTNFIQAAGEVLKTIPDVHFLLAGSGMTPDNKVIVDAARQTGITVRLHLLGERRDVPAITAALDVAVSSSAWGEGFSNVLGEAMACGVPCVATDVGDARQLLGNAQVVVPPQQKDQLSEAILKIYQLGVDDRRALGDKARTRIIENWTLEQVSRNYLRLYEELNKISRP